MPASLPHRAAVAAAVILAALLGAGDAAADSQPARRDALVFLRVLAYDKQLAHRAGDTVIVAVVYPAASVTARGERDAWLKALAEVKRIKVAGRAVVAVAVGYDGKTAFDRQMKDLAPAAVLLCAGLSDTIADVRAVTRARQILSFSRAERDARAGLAVALVSGAERDEIVINLAASRAEGAKLDAGLLQLARLVEGR